ncbi:adhesion domain-containing protein, partial [Citrobacter werkmanii]|uniref:adhesion domain-containing protein n=1 Tax=Citrobacter werkmanii TaxID=67827 RepID=UPI002655C689
AIYDGTDNANNGYRATYTFNANGTSSVDKSVYAWGYKDETAAAVTSSTDVVTTTGTVPNYQTKEADVGKIIELSVLPENGIGTKGDVVTQAATDAVDADARFTLTSISGTVVDAGSHAYKAKNTESISITGKMTYAGDAAKPVKNYTFLFYGYGMYNRQSNDDVSGSFSSTPLLIDGEALAVSGSVTKTTDSDGVITVIATQPNGPGVRNTFGPKSAIRANVKLENGDEANARPTFTVITSPDTDKANMWGHMPEVVDGIHRPLLSGEINADVGTFDSNNEGWAVTTYATAVAHCSVPSIDTFQTWFSTNGDATQYGWPHEANGETPVSISSTAGDSPNAHKGIWLSSGEVAGSAPDDNGSLIHCAD